MNSVEFPAVLVAAVAGLSAGLAVVALMKGKIKIINTEQCNFCGNVSVISQDMLTRTSLVS